MKLSKAIQGFLITIGADGYSPATITLYKGCTGVMLKYLGDKEVEDITTQDLRSYIYFIRHDYKPLRFGGDQRRLSPSAVDNYWKCMRSFFKFYDREYHTGRPDDGVRRATFANPEVRPYSADEVVKIIKAATTLDYEPLMKRVGFQIQIPYAVRNRAIITMLLDTGVRLGELCRMQVQDVDLENRNVSVRPFRSSRKSKPRVIPLGKVSFNAIWKFITEDDERYPDDLLFDITPSGVGSMFYRIKKRTGIDKVHAHRFRHTFATECIRANIDPFTVKYWLGHSSLTMVMRYVNFVQADYNAAHRRGSPGDRILKHKRI